MAGTGLLVVGPSNSTVVGGGGGGVINDNKLTQYVPADLVVG